MTLTVAVADSSHNHAASNITSGTLAIARIPTITVAKGGTGATDAATARTNLGVPSTTGSGASGTWAINISGTANLLALHNGVTNTTTRSTLASTWTGGVSGLKYVWGQAWKDTAIGSDTGDLVLGLRSGVYTSGGTELCMMIDGDYYSMGNKVLHAGNYSDYAAAKSHSHSYLPLSGGTLTGHLYANNGLTWTNVNWTAPGNVTCVKNGTSVEFSFDMGAGTQWHVWSTPNGASMLSCWADSKYVQVHSHLQVGSYANGSYALTADSFICNSWIRTTGQTGWYNETYGGGWYMTDANYLKTYNSKPVWLNNSLYIGTSSGAGTGIALYSGSAPNTYSIHMSLTSGYGTHGEVKGDWAMYFCFEGATNRGWVFKHAGSNVASISSSGVIYANNYIYSASYIQANTHFYLTSTTGCFYMRYNNTWYDVLKAHNNGNVTFNACGGFVYPAYSNSKGIIYQSNVYGTSLPSSDLQVGRVFYKI